MKYTKCIKGHIQAFFGSNFSFQKIDKVFPKKLSNLVEFTIYFFFLKASHFLAKKNKKILSLK
jgi:hypothetical protein